MHPWNRLLPTQPFFSDLYLGTHDELEAAIYASVCQVNQIPESRNTLTIVATEEHPLETMGSLAAILSFLQWLIRIIGAEQVLEIGTFVGFSAMHFARALPPGGTVTTIEKFNKFADIARSNFEANGFSSRIRLIEGDAHDVLAEMSQSPQFDFVFVDGNKERYADYLAMTALLVRPGGLIAVDDAFFHGDVLNPYPQTEKGRGVQACLEQAQTMVGWDRVLLPIGNGLLLLRNQSQREARSA